MLTSGHILACEAMTIVLLGYLVLLEVPTLLFVEVIDDVDFWVWSTGTGVNGVGGGGGGGGGVEGSTIDDANTSADAGNADTGDCGVGSTSIDADRGGGSVCFSGMTSGTIPRGGECTSTMLCDVLSFLFCDWTLSIEETLVLLLLHITSLYAPISSVKQFHDINTKIIDNNKKQFIRKILHLFVDRIIMHASRRSYWNIKKAITYRKLSHGIQESLRHIGRIQTKHSIIKKRQARYRI